MASSLAGVLKDARVKRGLTQRKVAEMIGVVPSFITFLERGKAHPSNLTLTSLARVLDLDEEFLLDLLREEKNQHIREKLGTRSQSEFPKHIRSIADILKTARIEQRLTQRKLAEMAGFTQSLISKTEARDCLPSTRALIGLIEVLNLDKAPLIEQLKHERRNLRIQKITQRFDLAESSSNPASQSRPELDDFQNYVTRLTDAVRNKPDMMEWVKAHLDVIIRSLNKL